MFSKNCGWVVLIFLKIYNDIYIISAETHHTIIRTAETCGQGPFPTVFHNSKLKLSKSQYIICINKNKPLLFNCAEGLLFNWDTLSCDTPIPSTPQFPPNTKPAAPSQEKPELKPIVPPPRPSFQFPKPPQVAVTLPGELPPTLAVTNKRILIPPIFDDEPMKKPFPISTDFMPPKKEEKLNSDGKTETVVVKRPYPVDFPKPEPVSGDEDKGTFKPFPPGGVPILRPKDGNLAIKT